MKHTTLKEIARETGFHYTTVARALKDNPLLKKETRRIIQEAAERMGYQPDPMMQALSRYRCRTSKTRNAPVIGCLSHHEPHLTATQALKQALYLAGIKEQAERLGYGLTIFAHADPGVSDKRWAEILLARDIRMVIAANFPYGQTRLELPWHEFSAVKTSVTLKYPPIDTTSCNQMQTVRHAYFVLRERGFRRIAFMCDEQTDERLGYMWSAGYMVETRKVAEEDRIPILDMGADFSAEKMRGLIDRWQPEVLVSYANEHLDLLLEAGYRVPGDLSYVGLNVGMGPVTLTGMAQSYDLVGRAAVNLVTKLHENNIRGIPEVASCQYIDSVWREGQTLGQPIRRCKASKVSTSADF